MKTASPKTQETMQNPHGIKACNLYNTDHAQVTHLTMAPGESLVKHITPVDVFFYVLQGKGTVLIGEETQEITTDTLVESPKDILHSWSNTGTEDLRVLVVKVPKPTTPTTFSKT